MTTFHSRLLCLLLPCLTPVAGAQTTLANVAGLTADGYFGYSIDEVGDINGDSYHDLAVGAPGDGNGVVRFLSGKYLATGLAPQFLGAATGSPDSPSFGLGVVALGDVTGDGVPDVAASAPPGMLLFNKGSISIISGASKTSVATYDFGNATYPGDAMARCGDVDGDGYEDFAVTVRGNAGTAPRVVVLSARRMVTGVGAKELATLTGPLNESWWVLSAGDLDGDGKLEIVVGNPNATAGAGVVYVYRGTNFTLLRTLPGVSGSNFGFSVDASRDVDLDGRKDVLVGAIATIVAGKNVGEAILFSGAKIAANTPPFDLMHWYGTQQSEHFGAAVRFSPDINGDFYADILVGAQDYDVFPGISMNNGRVAMFSGKTYEPLGGIAGTSNEQLGATLSRAWDYTGDVRFEFAVGAPKNTTSGSFAGSLRVITLFPAIPATYCTGKLNSQGCTPAMAYSGSPSLNPATSFKVTASNLINQKAGLLIYAFDAAALPFQGGTLCIGSPLTRTAGQTTGGNAGPDDCSGTLTFDFNALIQSGSVAWLNIQGTEVFAQYWSRDTASPTKSCLTNALRFVVNP